MLPSALRNRETRSGTWSGRPIAPELVMRPITPFHLLLLLLFSLPPGLARAATGLSADQIIQESVKANDRDWKAAPNYAFVEQDTVVKGGHTLRKKYQVLMIAGSTYNRLIAVNGAPLSKDQAQQEEQKLQQEILRRHKEGASARRQRIAKYVRERRQDHELMTEMTRAFQYKLVGNETVKGHKCYVIEATPKPGYAPPNRDTKVLTGMRGTMWIDEAQFQWVKVHAEVFKPVSFGLFIAHVQPGTEFNLEDEPVANGIWLPSHFSTRVKANILGVWSRNSSDDETYSEYRPMSEIRLDGQLPTK